MPPSRWAVIAIFLTCALAQNQCYYAEGRRAGSAIIPCGGGGQPSACCQLGDLCLSDSACWNPDHNVTYLYGCTDPTYQDPTCPWKCGEEFADAPYVGLDYCVNTTTNEWSCTHPPDGSDAIQPFPAQQCYSDSIIAFAGPPVLQPILSLPEVAGSSTIWFSQINPTSWTPDPNYTPTSTTIQYSASVPTTVEHVSTSSTSETDTATGPAAGQTTASGTEAPSTATSEADEGEGGLSSGAKIGIGVGVGVGALGFIALGAACFLLRRKRSTNRHQPVSQVDDMTDSGAYGVGVYPGQEKVKKPRPPSELPANTPAQYDTPSAGYSSGYGSGPGNSSTASNWDSPVPTHSSDKPAGPRPTGHDRVHELG